MYGAAVRLARLITDYVDTGGGISGDDFRIKLVQVDAVSRAGERSNEAPDESAGRRRAPPRFVACLNTLQLLECMDARAYCHQREGLCQTAEPPLGGAAAPLSETTQCFGVLCQLLTRHLRWYAAAMAGATTAADSTECVTDDDDDCGGDECAPLIDFAAFIAMAVFKEWVREAVTCAPPGTAASALLPTTRGGLLLGMAVSASQRERIGAVLAVVERHAAAHAGGTDLLTALLRGDGARTFRDAALAAFAGPRGELVDLLAAEPNTFATAFASLLLPLPGPSVLLAEATAPTVADTRGEPYSLLCGVGDVVGWTAATAEGTLLAPLRQFLRRCEAYRAEAPGAGDVWEAFHAQMADAAHAAALCPSAPSSARARVLSDAVQDALRLAGGALQLVPTADADLVEGAGAVRGGDSGVAGVWLSHRSQWFTGVPRFSWCGPGVCVAATEVTVVASVLGAAAAAATAATATRAPQGIPDNTSGTFLLAPYGSAPARAAAAVVDDAVLGQRRAVSHGSGFAVLSAAADYARAELFLLYAQLPPEPGGDGAAAGCAAYEALRETVWRVRAGLVVLVVRAHVSGSWQRRARSWATATRTVLLLAAVGAWALGQLSASLGLEPNTAATRQLRHPSACPSVGVALLPAGRSCQVSRAAGTQEVYQRWAAFITPLASTSPSPVVSAMRPPDTSSSSSSSCASSFSASSAALPPPPQHTACPRLPADVSGHVRAAVVLGGGGGAELQRQRRTALVGAWLETLPALLLPPPWDTRVSLPATLRHLSDQLLPEEHSTALGATDTSPWLAAARRRFRPRLARTLHAALQEYLERAAGGGEGATTTVYSLQMALTAAGRCVDEMTRTLVVGRGADGDAFISPVVE